MNTLTIIALVLIFLGGVGAILLTIGQASSTQKDKLEIINTTKSENTRLKLDLEEIKRERDLLNETLTDRDAEIQTQNKAIIDLTLRLSEKSGKNPSAGTKESIY
ncbi:hypothetical protein [Parapedobacter sp. 10938]|uniref:hypothetical protein n=1 Tax=Parapedobacter flavus TaxID=3110225 RepID=UPI002DBA4BD2|nr:hypothetical protein [Parapedobacter sp. 10938]MEC3879142.1 hypothetical protein [Parapedobacter sp. 10938]